VGLSRQTPPQMTDAGKLGGVVTGRQDAGGEER
jgi:hypothetical protein